MKSGGGENKECGKMYRRTGKARTSNHENRKEGKNKLPGEQRRRKEQATRRTGKEGRTNTEENREGGKNKQP